MSKESVYRLYTEFETKRALRVKHRRQVTVMIILTVLIVILGDLI